MVEVEGHVECPKEIGEEEVVENHGCGDAHYGVVDVECEEEEELSKEYAKSKMISKKKMSKKKISKKLVKN